MKNVIKAVFFVSIVGASLPTLPSAKSLARTKVARGSVSDIVRSLPGTVYLVERDWQPKSEKGKRIRLSALLVNIARFAAVMVPKGWSMSSTHGYKIKCMQQSTAGAKRIYIIIEKDICTLPKIGTYVGTLGGGNYVIEDKQELDSIDMMLIRIATVE